MLTTRGIPAGATREQIVDLAIADLLAGRDLDLKALSARAGVGRTTLYRYFGDRAGLLGEALWALTDQAWAHARRSTPGSGIDHVREVVKTFLHTIATSPPASNLMVREPRLAATAIMSPTGQVQRRAVARTIQLLTEHTDLPPGQVRPIAEIITQIAMTYAWAQLISGAGADTSTPAAITERLLHHAK